MYNDELDMIEDYFNVINEHERPDIVCFWNMSFDIQTFINRIKYLNKGDFESIMCPKEFQSIKKAYWYEDKKCNDISDSKNAFQIAGWTSYHDQMIVYAVIRKTMGKKESYALEAIAQEELGYGKQDMKGYTFKEFAYKDYPQFVEYSMNDSIVLRDIENKVADMEQMYAISQMTRTRMEKAMTKTICLKNMAAQFFFDRDLILSNNPNTSKLEHSDDKNEKFKGAFVADPALLDNTGMFVGGTRSDRIFERVCDLDLSSLYPSIILAYNIDFATMFGKVDIWDCDENGDDINRSEEFMNNWVSDDMVAIGAKWMNLPSAEELVLEFSEVA
jgi:DNA polymerase elongation subunit (family B)